MSKNSLSNSDIDKLLEEDQIYMTIPVLHIGKLQLGVESVIFAIISLILWLILWGFLGLFNINNSLIFFFSFIGVLIFNVLNASLNIQKSVENAAYETQNQIVKTEGLLGVVILVFVFLFNINMNNDSKNISYKLLTVILILLCISIITLETQNNSRNIRNVRLGMIQLYNQSIILFIMTIYLIYMGIIKK
jgi:hypothetical protein